MQQPKGHIDPVHPNYVCKLLKSLYGLKQAAHLWNHLLSKTLRGANYQQLLTDTSCFVKTDQQGTTTMIAVHVDDLLIAARKETLIRQTIQDLQNQFQVKELGPVQWLLGIAARQGGWDHSHPPAQVHQRHGGDIWPKRCSPSHLTLHKRG